MTELEAYLEDVRRDMQHLETLTTSDDTAWMHAAMDVADHAPKLLAIVETVLFHLDIADTASPDGHHPYQSIRRAVDLAFQGDK